MFLLARCLLGFALLIGIFLVSDFITQALEITLPPALLGIFILLLICLIFRQVPSIILLAAKPLLTHMVLFFIPATVGIMAYATLILEFPLALFLAIVVSTVVSMFISALISQRFLGSNTLNRAGEKSDAD
uniref:CidA/LrgA family protein n=1 Tax=Ningiella ruwaisensis TaxID=2364274 RepID=UPI0019D5AB71|nr:CidA/LrgA family protein [Ningiella ruwaisensis]